MCSFGLMWSKDTERIALILYGADPNKMQDYIEGAIYKASSEIIHDFEEKKVY